MRKWEEEYQKWQSGEMDKKYNELKAKMDAKKDRTIEDYKEFQKMEKIKSNLPKVENLMDYKAKLNEELTLLKEEYNARRTEENRNSDLAKVKAEVEENKKAIAEAEEKVDELVIKINETKDKDEIKALKEQRDHESKKLGDLNSKSAELKDKLEKNENAKTTLNKDLSGYTTEELRENCFKVSSEISKCNFAAGLFMKGASIDSVKLELKEFKNRKFTSKTPLPLTNKERAEKNTLKKETIPEVKKKEDKEKTIDSEREDNLEREDDSEKELIDPNDFATAFPKLAKVFPNMGDNIFGKGLLKAKEGVEKIKNIFKRDKTKVEDKVEEIIEKEDAETLNAGAQKEEKKSFRDYLRYDIMEVAEKGVNGLEEQRKEELKQKLEENRKAAFKRDAEKYGKNYDFDR